MTPDPRSYPRESALHRLQYELPFKLNHWEFDTKLEQQAKFVAKWNALLLAHPRATTPK